MAHENIEYGMNDVKELFDSSVMTGTIIEVNYDSDMAQVAIDGIGQKSGIPIFYHCADADTVAGGSLAFSEGDSVYILNKAGSMKIVGFTDGLKPCIFQFKITRDDEEIIDESYNPVFQVLNSNKDEVTGNVEYNSETEYWGVELDSSYEIDPEGYWVSFIGIEDSIDLQYPFKYKYDDQEKTEDLIRIGKYEAAVPYWVVAERKIFTDGIEYTLGMSRVEFVANTKGLITVKSSVPYQVEFTATNFNGLSELYESGAQPDCIYCSLGVWEWKYYHGTHPVPWPWGNIPIDRKAVMVATNSAGDPAITDTDDTAIIDHEFSGTVEGKDHWGLLNVSGVPAGLGFYKKNYYDTYCIPDTMEYNGTYLISSVGGGAGYPFSFVAKYDY